MSTHRVISPNKKVPVHIQELKSDKDKLFINIEQEKKRLEDEAMNKVFKDCVKEWCENTTSHGFANMVRTDSWLIRIVWIILVILFMGYCIFTVVQIVLTYFAYEVVVSYKVVSESPSPFPAITICNLNPFDVATENTTGTYINYVLSLNSITPNISVSEGEYGITLVQDASNVLKAYTTADTNLTSEDRKKLGFTMDTMLVSCFYNHEECNSTDFHWFYDSDFGNCYTFNDLLNGYNEFENTLTTSKSGPDNGLKMELFVGAGGAQDYYTIKKGVKVVVHKRGVRPLLKYDGIEIATGTAANVAITRTNYSKEVAPYSDCREDPNALLGSDSKYHKYTLQISKYYRKLCFELCLQYEQIVPNCACGDPSIPIVDTNLTICNSKSLLQCVKTQRDHFDETKNIDEVCGPYCPEECNSLVYSTSVSASAYPTDYYGKILTSQSNLITKFNPKNTFSPSNSGQMPSNGKRRKRQVTNSGTTTTTTNSVGGAPNAVTTTTAGGAPNAVTTTTAGGATNVVTTTMISNQMPGGSFQTTTGILSLNAMNPSGAGITNTANSKKTPTSSEVQSSVLMLSIYYEDLKYTYIEESPSMSFDTMMGLIGGQFGLYMGASFLSFVEILEMCINLGRLYTKYKRHKKVVKMEIKNKMDKH